MYVLYRIINNVTREEVVTIREVYSTDKYTYEDISNILNNIISKTAVGKIVRGERWKF